MRAFLLLPLLLVWQLSVHVDALTDLGDLGTMTEIAVQIPQLAVSHDWIVATGGPCENLLQTSYKPWPGVTCQQFGGKYYVTQIDISGLNLKGVLTSTFADLSKLKVLDLSDNQFTGKIPSSFGGMSALTTLNLQKNYIFGDIPEFTTALNTLQTFQAQENLLYGSLPSWLSSQPAATVNVSCNCFSAPLPNWCATTSCAACNGYVTAVGVTCDIFTKVFATGVSIKNAYSWLLNVDYPAYTVSRTVNGLTSTVTFTPDSLSEIDPSTGQELFRYNIRTLYGPWGLNVRAPPLLLSLLYSMDYTLTLINGASIKFTSSFSDEPFNLTIFNKQYEYEPGNLKLGFFVENWVWTRPLMTDSLRLNFKVTGDPTPSSIAQGAVTFGDPSQGEQVDVQSVSMTVGAYFENFTFTGPGLAAKGLASLSWNVTEAYLYVLFPRFTSALAYDPNFGVLVGGDGDGGGDGAGDGGDGTVVGIAVGVTVPVVVLLTLLVVGVGVAASVWKRHQIIARFRRVGASGGV